MPWSEWITEDYAGYGLDYTRTGVDYDLQAGARTGSTPGFTGVPTSQWYSQNVDGNAQVVFSRETAVVFTVAPGYETAALVDVPQYVENLEYGVEWDVNPDTGTVVEYAPGGVVTFDHWQAPLSGELSWNNQTNADGWSQPTADGLIRATLVGSDLTGGWPAFGAGTELALFRTNAITGRVPVGSGPDLPPTPSLALLVQDELNHPAPIPPAGNVSWDRLVSGRWQYDPIPCGRMPTFRYWIPGEVAPIPLRQRQRDDGLGSSTVRTRGVTSRQRSIRQRSYY